MKVRALREVQALHEGLTKNTFDTLVFRNLPKASRNLRRIGQTSHRNLASAQRSDWRKPEKSGVEAGIERVVVVGTYNGSVSDLESMLVIRSGGGA